MLPSHWIELDSEAAWLKEWGINGTVYKSQRVKYVNPFVVRVASLVHLIWPQHELNTLQLALDGVSNYWMVACSLSDLSQITELTNTNVLSSNARSARLQNKYHPVGTRGRSCTTREYHRKHIETFGILRASVSRTQISVAWIRGNLQR